MANEIVKMVAKKANLSEPVAQIAVDTVLNFLKGKLPPVVGNTLDSLLGSSSSTTASKTTKTTKSTKTTSSSNKSNNPLGDIVSGALGSLLGKK